MKNKEYPPNFLENENLEVSEEWFYKIIEKTPAGVCITDENGFYEYVNPSYCKIYGYSYQELVAEHFSIVVPENYKAELTELHKRFIKEKVEIRGEWEVINKTGESLTVIADAAYILGKDNRPRKVTFVIDITDRKKAENELELLNASLEQKVSERTAELININKKLTRNKIHLDEAQKVGLMGSWEFDIEKDHITWSDQTYQIFGVDPDSFEPTYENYLSFIHPDDIELLNKKVSDAINHSKTFYIEHRILLSDGSLKFVFAKGDVELDKKGNSVRLIGIVQDITEKKRIESEIKMLSNAIEESINIIIITDRNGRIIYVNKAFENITGYLKEEVIGQNPRILSTRHTSIETYNKMWEKISSGGIWRGEFKNKKKSGDNYWVQSLIMPIKNESNEIVKFMAIQEDISIKYTAEKKYRYLTAYDQLTKIYNREHFIQQLEKKLFKDIAATLIAFDIDDFNYINETYGNNTGDEILKRSSDFFKKFFEDKFGQNHILGRIGENKFAAFAEGLKPEDGVYIADYIRKKYTETCSALVSIQLTISAGIAACPENGKNADELLSALDAAIHISKIRGKNRVHLFSYEDTSLTKRSIKIRQREVIIKALEENRFEAWFQPILFLKDRKIHHFEVLARMRDEQGEIVLPGGFISAAESFGLIDKIDAAVAEKAMQKLSVLQSQGKDISFAMNLSGKEIENLEQLNHIKEIISKTGVSPGKLIFEITETAAINDMNKAVKFVDELKKMGCSFSLDDFGVGFTSFTYLKELNVDYVKIDGAFVRKINENRHDQAIVKAISDVSKSFNIKTIAEFVENRSILQLLNIMEVDYAQGFYIGAPEPEPVFEFSLS